VTQWCGLDIGGANLKYALGRRVGSVPFPMWKLPHELSNKLEDLILELGHVGGIAVTMTGELADCFETRAHGVQFIVNAVTQVAGNRTVRFRTNDGRWLDADSAIRHWEAVAAANWQPSASVAAKCLPGGSGFLIDIGSTTTDTIPIRDGIVSSLAKQDLERLQSGELCYLGVSRTPVCSFCQSVSVAGQPVSLAREVFATSQDVLIALRVIPENKSNVDTCDGRPATILHARQRIARMVCSDVAVLGPRQVDKIAMQMRVEMESLVGTAIRKVVNSNPDLPLRFIVCGQEEDFACRTIESQLDRRVEITRISERFDRCVSAGMAAFSVAQLATGELSALVNSSVSDTKNVAVRSKGSVLKVRVVKVGGSLFDLETLPRRLHSWLAQQSDACNVFVTGGGRFVDELRDWDNRFGLESSTAHKVAIELMSITTRLMHNFFPDWPIVSDPSEIVGLDKRQPGQFWFDTSDWLVRRDDVDPSWDTTSDSCAAHLAKAIGAEEIVLLKSTLPTKSHGNDIGLSGFTDRQFCDLVKGIPAVRLVDFRSEDFSEVRLRLDTSASSKPQSR
jgi:probable H4MPT-linked C1 transfer pathway protein